jgi:two-component system CitB family sensor kinase
MRSRSRLHLRPRLRAATGPVECRSIAGQILVFQFVMVVVATIASSTALALITRHTADESAANLALVVAETFAEAPDTRAGLLAPEPSAVLQPVAEATRSRTGVDFLVVMSPSGLRYTHPDPAQINHQFIGHIEPAVRGHAFTETYTGTLGRSIRAVVPVFGVDGSVVGLVSAGITTKSMNRTKTHQILAILIANAGAILLALIGNMLLSQRVRRQTLGLRPDDIARLSEHHDAVLHNVREGVLILDGSGRLLLINDEACRLLEIPAGAEGLMLDEIGLAPALIDLLNSHRPLTEATLFVRDKVLALDQRPTVHEGRTKGSVVSVRDMTELRALAGELDAVRDLAEALHAQTHEASNRMHTVLTLVQLEQYGQAIDFATATLTGVQQLADRLLRAVDEPALAALLLAKADQARERGIDFVVTADTSFQSFEIEVADLISLVGNLLDNALDAALSTAPAQIPAAGGGMSAVSRVTVTVRADASACLVRVSDTGPGLRAEQVADAFSRGWTTKRDADGGTAGRGIGLTLVRQIVERHSGTITVDGKNGTVFTVHLSTPTAASLLAVHGATSHLDAAARPEPA